MSSVTFYQSDFLSIDFFPCYNEAKAKNIAFIFNPNGNRRLNGNPYGGNLLCRNGFDVISFKTISDDWYQSVPRYVFDLITLLLGERKYTKKVAYGSSMGGYAAIAFSKLLKCDAVLAYSPQFKIDQPFDTRWQSFANKISWIYEINRESINQSCQFFLVYDNKDLDGQHIEKMRSFFPADMLTEIELPYVGHPAIDYCADLDIVKSVSLDVLQNGDISALKIRQEKQKSKAYLFSFSSFLLRRNKLQWALSVIDKAISLEKSIGKFHYQRSLILIRLNRQSEALESIKMAVDVDPKHPYAWAHYATLLADNCCYEEARKAIEKSILLNPCVAEFHSKSSFIYEKLNRESDAIASAKQAILNDQGSPHLKVRLLQLLTKNKLFSEATEVVTSILNTSSPDENILVFCGNLMLACGEFLKATQSFNCAINKNPKLAAAHFGLSSTLARQKNLDEAISAVKAALTLDEKNTQFINHLSHLLAERGTLDDALNVAQTGLTFDTTNAYLTAHYAGLLVRKEKFEEAAFWYKKAIDINSSVAGFHIDLSLALEKCGNLEEAIVAAKTAATLDATDIYIKNRLDHLNALGASIVSVSPKNHESECGTLIAL